MSEEIHGHCVEFVCAASGDPVNGLDVDTVRYERAYFGNEHLARDFANAIAGSKRVAMGDVAIHHATFAKHGKLVPYWRIDDEPHTEWVEMRVKEVVA